MAVVSFSTQSRRAPQPARAAGAAARLAFAAVLLVGDESVECAQATVSWLGERGGARRAICVLIDAESGRIERVTAHGVPAPQLDSLSLALDQLKAASEQLEEKVREATAELVRRNELLQRQHLELEQASQLKSQFLANMSHEFRTPLNAILGSTSMLLAGVSGELQPPQKQKLQRVDSNGRHLLSIINDILDISRIEAGKMPLHFEAFELSALIAELLAEVEPLIQKSRLQTIAELPPMPPVYCDRQKAKQIVLNLLTNAIKFTPQGFLKVSAVVDKRELRIAVQDSGIGIAPRDRETVFEDRLATMLGGCIELTSAIGHGSTFTLVIPRKGKRR